MAISVSQQGVPLALDPTPGLLSVLTHSQVADPLSISQGFLHSASPSTQVVSHHAPFSFRTPLGSEGGGIFSPAESESLLHPQHQALGHLLSLLSPCYGSLLLGCWLQGFTGCLTNTKNIKAQISISRMMFLSAYLAATTSHSSELK